MAIAILGPGRLGRSLAVLLDRAGVEVVLGRDPGLARGATAVLLTVPDARIGEVAAAVPPGPVVLHCSGAADVDLLRPHRPAGSLHPLMSFPGPEHDLPDLAGVPAAVAGDPEARQIAGDLARRLGMVPLEVPGDRRLYHAAAVLAGNFGAVILADAARVLEAAGVAREEAAGALVPLMLASIANAGRDPAATLTGPAARGDVGTVAAHLAALTEHGLGEVAAAYAVLTQRAGALVGARRGPR